MPIAAFYLSTHRPTRGAVPILVGKKVVFIRAEAMKGHDLVRALDRATPRRGEVLMNTHRV